LRDYAFDKPINSSVGIFRDILAITMRLDARLTRGQFTHLSLFGTASWTADNENLF
jgi:hypothetical protein